MTRRTETDGWKSVWSSNPVRVSTTDSFTLIQSLMSRQSVIIRSDRLRGQVSETQNDMNTHTGAGFYLAALYANQITCWLNTWICRLSCCGGRWHTVCFVVVVWELFLTRPQRERFPSVDPHMCSPPPPRSKKFLIRSWLQLTCMLPVIQPVLEFLCKNHRM